MKAWRLRSRLALSIVGVTGVALMLALAVASPGSGGVSAVDTCNTTLAQAASAGAEGIIVTGATGCETGDKIILNQGESNEECQVIERVAPGIAGNVVYLMGALAYDHSAGETVVEVSACPTPTATATGTPPPTETAAPTETPPPTGTVPPTGTLPPTATPTPRARMFGCPKAGKFAIAWWAHGANGMENGEAYDGVDMGEALATCEEEVDFAYYLDPDSNNWLGYFPGWPDLSEKRKANDGEGFILHGAFKPKATPTPGAAPPPTPGATPPPTPTPTPTPTAGPMYGCPREGMWAIAHWDGGADGMENGEAYDGVDIAEALATCGEGAVDVAYALDPDSNDWLGYSAEWPDLSEIGKAKENQGFILHGAMRRIAKIAFASDRDDNWEIYVMKTDGSDQTNLTNNPANDSHPAWSHDGSKIAFASNRDGNWEIYVMNADGTGQTNLTNNPADDRDPAWWSSGHCDLATPGSYGLPKIAFTSDRDGNDEIYTMKPDGSGQTRVTNNPADDSRPAWSPDGRIAFTSDRDGNDEIYVMDAWGTGQANRTNNSADDGAPDWSPDCSKIAFESDREFYGLHYDEIYVMNSNGTGQTRLTESLGAFDRAPAWSPDGSKIAFSGAAEANADIYVMDADGKDRMRLTYPPGQNVEPDWSP